MQVESPAKLPWFALKILGLVYGLMGWYLAAHDVVWIVGAVVTVAALAIAWKGIPPLRQLSGFGSRSLFIVTVLSLMFSLGALLLVTDFQFLGLMFLPSVTLLWANFEMRSAEFSQRHTLFYLTAIAALGLAIGEAIDLLLLPSMQY